MQSTNALLQQHTHTLSPFKVAIYHRPPPPRRRRRRRSSHWALYVTTSSQNCNLAHKVQLSQLFISSIIHQVEISMS